jgi:hypothetical protein
VARELAAVQPEADATIARLTVPPIAIARHADDRQVATAVAQALSAALTTQGRGTP